MKEGQHVHLIVIPNYWGKGDTETEAWGNIVKQGGYRNATEAKKSKQFIHLVCPFETRIDKINGTIYYPEGHGPENCIDCKELHIPPNARKDVK